MNITEFKIALVKNHLSAGALAKKIGLSRTSMSYKMTGRREFTSDEIKRISNCLNLTVEEREKIFFTEMVD